MSFSVDTPALAGLPALLDRMQEDARAATTYLDAETSTLIELMAASEVAAGVPTGCARHSHEDEEPDEFFRGFEHENRRWGKLS